MDTWYKYLLSHGVIYIKYCAYGAYWGSLIIIDMSVMSRISNLDIYRSLRASL